MKTLIFFAIIILPSFGGVGGGLFAQITLIPDPNFEQALINLGIDSDGVVNGQVLTSDVEGVEVLDVSNIGIQDMTGIEDFAALKELNVRHNDIASINLTENIHLKKFSAYSFDLIDVDFSQNSLLEYISIERSSIEELDVTHNTLLKELVFGFFDPAESYHFESLDLSNNPLLEKLWLHQIATLEYINLKSGSNHNLTDVWIECFYHGGGNPCSWPCIEVDDVHAAQSNQPPYNSWYIFGYYSEYCPLGIPSLNKTGVLVYPNPAVDELFIYNPTAGTIEVGLYNISGKLVLQKEFNHTNNTLNISDIEVGVYFLVVETPQGEKTVKKVVKK